MAELVDTCPPSWRLSNLNAPPPALPHRVCPLTLPSRPHRRARDSRWSRRHSGVIYRPPAHYGIRHWFNCLDANDADGIRPAPASHEAPGVGS
jgi:hypothetical protein